LVTVNQTVKSLRFDYNYKLLRVVIHIEFCKWKGWKP